MCACSARSFEVILSPSRRITSPSGPMNTMPSSRQRSANSACSATKPHPTQTASARAAAKALPAGRNHIAAFGLLRGRVDDLRGAERHRLIRLADEHGMAVRLGEESDGAQRRAMLLIELARRVDEAHGGFATVDNRYALKFEGHTDPDRAIAARTHVRITLRLVPRHRRLQRPQASGVDNRSGNFDRAITV